MKLVNIIQEIWSCLAHSQHFSRVLVQIHDAAAERHLGGQVGRCGN